MTKFKVTGEVFYDGDEEEDVHLKPCADDILSKPLVLMIEASTEAEAERLFHDHVRKIDPSATGFTVERISTDGDVSSGDGLVRYCTLTEEGTP